VLLCFILIAGLVYTPVTIPQLASTQAVAVAEAAVIKINKKQVTLYKGSKTTLKITGTKKKVTWSSGNKSVATVNKSGRVTAKKTGTATIRAKVGRKTYSCKVTVKAVPKLNKSSVTLVEGEKLQLSIKGYKIGKPVWSSLNKSVASVSKTGVITAKQEGNTTIRVKLGGKTLKCKITVKEKLVKAENVQIVKDYANKLYNENKMEDYTEGGFTWDVVPSRKTGWIYYSGFMLEAFLHTDFDEYSPEIREFYKQYIVTDDQGNTRILKYTAGELDSAMPGVGMLSLINENVLSKAERKKFVAGVNYIYNQLENQTIYPEAGGLLLHSQTADGEPRKHWTRWNICLDGVYMSQLFLIRLAETIESEGIEIRSLDGSVVTSDQLWNDIYNRMTFVMDNMINQKTGLLNHGYSVNEKMTNGASWSRGIGWFMMALMEAAEQMPDPEKRAKLVEYYNQQMSAIVEWQDPESFLWYNVTDGREEYFCEVKTETGVEVIYNKPESSGSAMFTYCLLRGYHNGLLKDEHFREAGLKGFNALVETKITDEGLIDIYRSSSVTGDKNRYQVNGYVKNEGKGIAPLIMASKYAY
jgi:rhamnogalacturonyl hydrolase YesR